MSEYHVPVMLEECIAGLNLKSDGSYVDVTFGAGGHSQSILNNIGVNGHLYGFDQDDDAEANRIDDPRFVFIKANFRYVKKFLRVEGVRKVDGILADLGVSSYQLDFPERGFSYRFDAELDMRMNHGDELTAAIILKEYSKDDLQMLFSRFGEVRNARTLARLIDQEREVADVKTTFQLNEILERVRFGPRAKYFAQVYQALRMEVNQEVQVLEEMLQGGLDVLKPGGRFVVMSYHSIEDRIVKNFFKTGDVNGVLKKDDFGVIDRPFKLINKKVILASVDEVRRNSRAKSAKLRIAEKI
ncbi:MAG: 16S rRNA (cytosine(1402)-N(4))-methyltransferase RsmH [Saprospiraceae bacterium]|nr:16S rRNA (cytosine(1402)-N(4))-methyltransferase RsmH [Saprospiraceae bacterium]